MPSIAHGPPPVRRRPGPVGVRAARPRLPWRTLEPSLVVHHLVGQASRRMGFFATRPFNSPLVFLAAAANLFVGPTSCQPATKTAQVTIYFYWEALGSSGQRVDAKRAKKA